MNMKAYDLSDAQWCFLDLLLRAKKRGIPVLSRMEILHSPTLPQGAAMKLVWGALTIPAELVKHTPPHDFEITEAGASLYNLRFGTKDKAAQPSQIADGVICLPDLSNKPI
jgi:hypothetical protein